ncbi:hypothetical protein M164_0143 [Sulfolobus islandicus M.16.4]|uniref:Uncharacterized protein n=1 Tax=Saccharolobus islandicus (strain M.16.4 / Kamchatka \|nr:hypothetical protein M164_0143 [Sulfolobus islandicus M.16.4]
MRGVNWIHVQRPVFTPVVFYNPGKPVYMPINTLNPVIPKAPPIYHIILYDNNNLLTL